MKNLCFAGLLVVCSTASISVSAQQPVIRQTDHTRPVLMAQLPKRFECTLPALQQLSRSRISDHISLPLGITQFAGEVVDKVQQSPGVLSMNIRATNMPGALFTISVITEADNTQKLVGRIVNPQSDEVLVLTEENNRYFWVKQPKQFFLTE